VQAPPHVAGPGAGPSTRETYPLGPSARPVDPQPMELQGHHAPSGPPRPQVRYRCRASGLDCLAVIL
jgi:hypothetical protein